MLHTEQSHHERLIARYRWRNASPIAQMEVERIAGDKLRCSLIPRDGYAQGALATFPKTLNSLGFEHVYADVMEGKNILVVDRIEDTSILLDALKKHQMIIGRPKEILVSAISEKKGNPLQRALSTIQSDTLKWSGRVGLAGHAAILADGLIKKNQNLIFGASGALNPILLSIYGSGKSEINFNDMMEKMRTYFAAEGVNLPAHDQPEESPSLLKGLDRLLATYPVQIGHTLGSIGAYNLMRAGMKQFHGGNRHGINKILIGATSLTGNMAVTLVPEAKKDKETERTPIEDLRYGVTHIPQGVGYAMSHPHRVPQKLWEFIQDSPLRFNALLNLSDNILWFRDAMTQLKQQRAQPVPAHLNLRGKLNRMPPYLSFVTAFSFAIATFLTAISSKNRDSQFLLDEMYDPMYAAAAKFLVQMPKEDRQDTLSRMAVFLSAQEEVRDGKVSTEQIVEEVSKRVDVMECSPWLSHLEFCRQNIASAQPTPAT